MEAAAPAKPRGNEELVAPNHCDQQHREQPAHRSSSRSSRQVARASSPAAPCRAITTRSVPVGKTTRSCRNHSRTRRLTRLRRTAEPTRRLTASPRRRPREFRPGAVTTTKWVPARRRPVRFTRWKSLALRSRSFRWKRRPPASRSSGIAVHGEEDRGRGSRLLGRDADGEPLSALGPASLDHRPAVLGLHPSTKAVASEAANSARLIGSLHDSSARWLGPWESGERAILTLSLLPCNVPGSRCVRRESLRTH